MATTRLMPLHTGKGRTVGQAISAIIDYTENPQKTDGGRLITSWQCDSRIADAEFLFAKNQYTQKTGRVRGEDDVIAYHLRQSFVPGEITPEDANRLGCELAKRFTKGNHAYIVCTHIDKAHIHNHVIWNSTALSQTRKFRNFWGSSRAVRRLNDTICIENGYSIVENPKRHGKSYNKWLGDKKKPSHRERICTAIDDALTQKPDSFETLLELLRQAGYEVKGKKVPSLLGSEQKKSIRMDTLGDGYTPADLRAVIAGEKAHTPRKSAAAPVKPQKRSGNLLVDIQTKLRAGKGAGYARWATLFNLKQMAQTVAYLQDHELLDYAVLSEKAAAASRSFVPGINPYVLESPKHNICFIEAALLSHTVLIGILYIMFFYLSTVFTDSYIKNLRLTFPHHSAIVIVKQRANARNRTRFPDSPHHREPSAGVRRYAVSGTILCEQCTEPSRCHRDSPVTGKLIAAGLRPQR